MRSWPTWGGVWRVRTSSPGGAARARRRRSSRARRSAWLNPRSRSRAGCRGTASANRAATPSTARRSAISIARGPARRRQPWYLKRWIASSTGPSYAAAERSRARLVNLERQAHSLRADSSSTPQRRHRGSSSRRMRERQRAQSQEPTARHPPQRGGRRRSSTSKRTCRGYGAGQEPLNSPRRLISADENLVAGPEVDPIGRAGRQLQHAVGTPFEPDHAPPGGQLAIHLLDPLLAVEEDGVDGEV